PTRGNSAESPALGYLAGAFCQARATLRGPPDLANVHEPTTWVAFPLRILEGSVFFGVRSAVGPFRHAPKQLLRVRVRGRPRAPSSIHVCLRKTARSAARSRPRSDRSG